MDDWRIYEEEFFENLELFEIRFPDYWKKSYSEKNDFYRMIVLNYHQDNKYAYAHNRSPRAKKE